MDRRDLIGALGALGFAAVSGTALRADHDSKVTAGGKDMLAPVKGMHAHFCGIHIAKENPTFQLIVQHFCAPLNDSMHQCLLFALGVAVLIAAISESKQPQFPAAPPARPAAVTTPWTEVEAADFQRQWANYLREDVVSANALNMPMVLIPPGEIALAAPAAMTAEQLRLPAMSAPSSPARLVVQRHTGAIRAWHGERRRDEELKWF